MSDARDANIRDLQQDRRNANRGTERGAEMIERSLQRLGAGRSVLIDKHQRLIAGNKTAKAAKQLGMSEVVVVPTDGTQLVAVQRMDLDLLNDPEARELAFADNRTNEVDLDIDPVAVAQALDEGIELGAYFYAEEIDAMVARDAKAAKKAAKKAAGGGENPAPLGSVPTRVHAGEIWQLGTHRLACGDSRDAALVARLTAGATLQMVWTDPPYGVDYGAKEQALAKAGIGNGKHRPILNDALGELEVKDLCRKALAAAASHLAPGATVYIASPAGTLLPYFIDAIGEAGLEYLQALAWVKNTFVLGRADYHYRHETVLYGWLPGAPRYQRDALADSVFEVDKPAKSEEHPTMKPLALILQHLEQSSQPGDIVYDAFLGSGSTLIAAERSERTCYGVELSEAYCDVCLARWEAESGEEAVQCQTPAK